MERRGTRIALVAWTALVVALPLDPARADHGLRVQQVERAELADPGLHDEWFRVAWHSQDVRDASWLSVRVALVATGVAILLGSVAAFGVARFSFFGREADLVPARAADRVARHRHRHGAQLVLHRGHITLSCGRS